MQGEGEDDGSQQPNIDPGRHPDQGLVLRQTVGGGGVNISKHVDNVDAQLDMKDLHGSFSFMLQRSHNLIRLSSKLIKCHINVYINHNKSA